MIDIAVAIPTYNSAKYIEKAINSVKNQSIPNIPIYIYDNNSNDNTIEICKKHSNVKIIKNEKNYGFSLNIMKCLYETPHKYVALLLSDDWYEESHLESGINVFQKYNDIFYYFCSAKFIYKNNGDKVIIHQLPIKENRIISKSLYIDLLKSHSIPVSSLIINKQVLKSVPKSCWLRRFSDWEFTIHISNIFNGWGEKKPNVCFLQREDSLGQKWYLDSGYNLDRINFLFQMNEYYPIPTRILYKIILYRWFETLLMSIYKVDSGIEIQSVIKGVVKVESSIKLKTNNSYIKLMLVFSRMIFIAILNNSPAFIIKKIIMITRSFGIGKFIIK